MHTRRLRRACRACAGQRRRLLEDLALLDRFWRDPAGEWNSLTQAVETSGSPLLRQEWYRAQGVTGLAVNESNADELEDRSFPALDDWRAWLDRGRLPRPGSGAGTLVTFSWTSWAAREEGQVERGYAGGTTLWLIETAEGWRVFTSSTWIT